MNSFGIFELHVKLYWRFSKSASQLMQLKFNCAEQLVFPLEKMANILTGRTFVRFRNDGKVYTSNILIHIYLGIASRGDVRPG